jgi:hypothetical protein
VHQLDFNKQTFMEINSLIGSYLTTEFLIMGVFNCSIRERQVHKQHLFDVGKQWNFEGCNSAENTISKSKHCNAEENKYTNI